MSRVHLVVDAVVKARHRHEQCRFQLLDVFQQHRHIPPVEANRTACAIMAVRALLATIT